jgi:sulfonate transport system substrate-binding protein
MSRTIALAAPAVTVGALVCACSSSSTTSAQSAADAADPATGSGVVINFGDQQQDLETLLDASGVLKGAAYTVNFVEFDSGPLVDAGFAAHQIDIGSMGDLPASLAVKSGLPVQAIMVSKPIGADDYLVAEPGITSIAQLRGKTVAYTTGTAEQAFALRALKQAGLTQSDVTQVNVSLEQLGTVLQSGAAVASVVDAGQKADYELDHPGATTLATDLTVNPPTYGYLLAATAALDNPAKLAAIKDLTKRVIEAQNWEKTHQAQFITDYYVDVEHQTPQVAKLILAAGGTETYVALTAGVQQVLPNVCLGLKSSRDEQRRLALDALAEVGLPDKAGAWPVTLSGGEAQRVALARALVREPRLMLLDEPFGALDALTRSRMHVLLRKLWTRHEPAVLLVTHDVDEAIGLADRVLVLDRGVITFATPVTLDRPRDPGSDGFIALRRRLLAELGVTAGEDEP